MNELQQVIDDIKNNRPVDPELLRAADEALERISKQKPEDIDVWAKKLAEDFCAKGALGGG